MKKQEPATLLDILDSTLREPKTYEQVVDDGAAIERLRANPDFARYQRLLSEAYLALVERLRLADPATLPALQGALIQHSNVLKLPGKVVEAAVRMVETKRSETERTEAAA